MAKILIVDDDRNLVATLAEIMREKGYIVFTAFDGYQGVRIALEETPSLVILDIMMPAGGGLSVYDSLKHSAITANIPIIFSSALSPQEVLAKIPQINMNNFVRKPFDIESLIDKIKAILKI